MQRQDNNASTEDSSKGVTVHLKRHHTTKELLLLAAHIAAFPPEDSTLCYLLVVTELVKSWIVYWIVPLGVLPCTFLRLLGPAGGMWQQGA